MSDKEMSSHCWVLPAGSHGWGCLVGEGCGSVLLPKQLSRRKQFLFFLFFSFCFALREERELWCVKFGLSSVIKSELSKGGNYNYRMFLTPWTKMNDAVHSSLLCKCFGDYLTLHTHCLFKTSSILEYANFKIIVTLLVAKWIFSFVCKIQFVHWSYAIRYFALQRGHIIVKIGKGLWTLNC